MKIKARELRQKPKNELEMMLREGREKLRGLKNDMAAKKLKNTRQVRGAKKQIAQILTILNIK